MRFARIPSNWWTRTLLPRFTSRTFYDFSTLSALHMKTGKGKHTEMAPITCNGGNWHELRIKLMFLTFRIPSNWWTRTLLTRFTSRTFIVLTDHVNAVRSYSFKLVDTNTVNKVHIENVYCVDRPRQCGSLVFLQTGVHEHC